MFALVARRFSDPFTSLPVAFPRVGGRAQGLYGEAKDRLHDVVDHIGDDTQEAVRQGGQYLRSGAKAVERSVESYPILYLAAAAAAGFFASMLLNEHFDRRYFRR